MRIVLNNKISEWGRLLNCSMISKIKQILPPSWQISLYASRFLAGWGDRLWQFVGAIFMMVLQPENLQLVAVYGLCNSLSVLVFCAFIGSLVDHWPRLRAASVFLAVQNCAVCITCVVVSLHLVFGLESLTYLVVTLAILFSVIANLASIGCKISMEKDWVVVICEGDGALLAKVNANMRTIDLLCNLAAPILAGQLIFFTSHLTAAIIVGAWNIVSAVVELSLLRLIYKRHPGLSVEKKKTTEIKTKGLRATWSAWVAYLKHPVRDAGLALACVYMTVLGFCSITWGYCLLQGVSEAFLGIATAISAGVGVLGARIFPHARSRIGLEKTGMVAFAFLSLCLTLSVASIWSPGSPFDLTSSATPETATSETPDSLISVALLLSGIITARLGLWVADLSVQQIFQEEVEQEIRGSICGVQNGLQSAMDLLKFVLVITLPNANTFGILIILSFTFVSTGGIFFLVYCLKTSKKAKQGEAGKNDPEFF